MNFSHLCTLSKPIYTKKYLPPKKKKKKKKEKKSEQEQIWAGTSYFTSPCNKKKKKS